MLSIISLILRLFLGRGERTTKLDNTRHSDRLPFSSLQMRFSWNPYHYAPDVQECQQL